MSTGSGRSRRVRPAFFGTATAVVLLLTYVVFFPAAWLRTEVRGAQPARATFHDGACLLGGCSVTLFVAGERVTAGLPVGTRAKGHVEGDMVDVLHAPGEPQRVALAHDTGRGAVAALLAVPGGATLFALLAGAVHMARNRPPKDPAQAV
ncbi:hypothetical protein [Streptomyces sp. NPDC054940]